MDDIKIKKEIIDKIKDSSNILITVSNDPSVDELSAALGLTLALNKIEKYATAIFSGATPPAISFLEPEKTFEENTDSLRDFIIALNREKADHLRFKPDGDYVKIFITPYRSIITPEDLEFSQGDFNVELVITLGVDDKGHLDDALDNHGQILHDATVASITAGEKASSLGNFNWHNPKASSVSEMVTGLIEALKEDKKEPIIDGPIATALLTGIVAETDRFSNAHTTSGVMTVAANLMNAGADQQLIAFKLEQSGEVGGDDSSSEETKSESSKDDDSAYTLSINRETKEATLVPADKPEEPSAEATNAYALESDGVSAQEGPAADVVPLENPGEAVTELSAPAPEPIAESIEPSDLITSRRAYVSGPAADSAYAPDPEDQPSDTRGFPGAPAVAPGSVSVSEMPAPEGRLHSAYATEDEAIVSPPEDTQPADTPVETTAPVTEPAIVEPPADPVVAPASEQAPPVDLGLPMPPPLPDFSAGVTPPPALPVPNAPQPEILGDILQPEPAPQAVQPVAPVAEVPVADLQPAPAAAEPQPVAANPGQFQIPAQQ